MTKPWDDEDTEQLHVLHKQAAFLCGMDNGTVALCMRSVDALRGQATHIRELEARVGKLSETAMVQSDEIEALRAQLAASIPREKLADALEAATGRCRCRLDLAKEVRSGTFPPMDETTKGVAGE